MKEFLQGLMVFGVLFVVIPFALGFLTVLLGRVRRRRAGGLRQRPVWPVLAFGVGAVAALIGGIMTLGSSLLYVVGLTDETMLHVTATEPGHKRSQGGWVNARVSGDYQLDGALRHVDDISWPRLADRPAKGDVVEIAVSPLWPHPVFEGAGSAVNLGVIGVGLTGLGAFLTYGAQKESRRD